MFRVRHDSLSRLLHRLNASQIMPILLLTGRQTRSRSSKGRRKGPETSKSLREDFVKYVSCSFVIQSVPAGISTKLSVRSIASSKAPTVILLTTSSAATRSSGQPERLRITLAVAGFTRDQLDVTIEENQLVIRGRQQDDKARQYIHRGIAARHFQRTFVLAEGMQGAGRGLEKRVVVGRSRPA